MANTLRGRAPAPYPQPLGPLVLACAEYPYHELVAYACGHTIGELRDWLERDNAAVEERQKPYKGAMTTIEGALQAHLLANDLQNMKADGIGTAFLKTATHVRLADRGAFVDYIQTLDTDPFDFFTNAVRKEKVLEYFESTGAALPGVDITSIQEVQIRRS